MADTNPTLELILATLDGGDSIADSRAFCSAQQPPIEHEAFVGDMKSLVARDMVRAEQSSEMQLRVTGEGESFVAEGSPEYRVFCAVPAEGIALKDLKDAVGESVFKIGNGQCMKRKWLVKQGDKLVRKEREVGDATADTLRSIQAGEEVPPAVVKELKKRKLVSEVKVTRFAVSKGPKFSRQLKKYATELTMEMLQSGSWKDAEFKPYNFDAQGVEPPMGRLHPLMKMRETYRDIFLEMGFQEMPTNMWVESSFWNFDSLFQPQQHPARDAHDTFFLSSPARALEIPADYQERVKTMHESGGSGSIGWRYNWSEDEARKNIMRTHTTAVSARMLYKLAQQETFTPVKYFSIDRVFRNETQDATHLAEFNQVEGLVADYGLTLGNLMGIIGEFFRKLGIEKIQFKPAYNPYTEPSMEVFSWHDGHKKWLEIGNSGMFRPEMLTPMGLPDGVRVIAWGLSLERPAMIKYGYDNIRSLVGSKVQLPSFIKNDPICR
eukprot:TRINITY_DN1725_c0_g1_i1.p1 TRINITY_DN1725_c0_g1~~TRINITY_DN1725_c0_g1_i1.p1  ORF type:complete len:561 (+),score=190.72 TRINITY_DN1725_c0_g1_i1:202-1683(+)